MFAHVDRTDITTGTLIKPTRKQIGAWALPIRHNYPRLDQWKDSNKAHTEPSGNIHCHGYQIRVVYPSPDIISQTIPLESKKKKSL